MLDVNKTVVINLVGTFPERCPNESQGGVFGKFVKQKRKVVRVKGNVGVQISDRVVIELLQFGIPCIEGMNFSGEMALKTLRPSNKLNPWMFNCIALNYFICTIGRTVADNYPSRGSN